MHDVQAVRTEVENALRVIGNRRGSGVELIIAGLVVRYHGAEFVLRLANVALGDKRDGLGDGIDHVIVLLLANGERIGHGFGHSGSGDEAVDGGGGFVHLEFGGGDLDLERFVDVEFAGEDDGEDGFVAEDRVCGGFADGPDARLRGAWRVGFGVGGWCEEGGGNEEGEEREGFGGSHCCFVSFFFSGSERDGGGGGEGGRESVA